MQDPEESAPIDPPREWETPHRQQDEQIDAASQQSFPASDPPSWWAGVEPGAGGSATPPTNEDREGCSHPDG